MKIKILGAHNSETLRTRHTSLLIDDMLVMDAGSLTSHFSIEGMKRLKAVLLTHSHFDHIRDIPCLAINLYLNLSSIDIYTHRTAWKNMTAHLLNGKIYPEYHKKPADKPTLRFHPVEPLQEFLVEGYSILPVKVEHSVPAMGYQLTSPDGKRLFYTGDTGNKLAGVWPHVSPDVLFIEVTASNKWEDKVKNNGHLTPRLLKNELKKFYRLKQYFPHIFVVHLNHSSEKEIKAELAEAGDDLGVHIIAAREGMEILL
jgi:ribonuclease BN (tRNA processing enzyme)